MISNIGNNNITFRKNELEYTHDTLLKNTPANRLRIGIDKFTNSLSVYPAKGLKGSKNANFYEFLTMGTVPYLIGSEMLMLGFNCARPFLTESQRPAAAKYGNKMALGVVLYGVMKSLSKNLVTQPVRMATGVDTEMPYENIVYPLPKEAGEQANIEVQHQQSKVFDSKDMFSGVLLPKGEDFTGKYLNEYKEFDIDELLG